MPELVFPLRIVVPELVDAFTLSEVDDDAEPHDRTQADAFERWLGGLLSEAVDAIAPKLPDGFEARIGGRFHASPSLECSRSIYRMRMDHLAAERRQRADDDDRRAAEGDEQRDYAEERFNRDLQREQ